MLDVGDEGSFAMLCGDHDVATMNGLGAHNCSKPPLFTINHQGSGFEQSRRCSAELSRGM